MVIFLEELYLYKSPCLAWREQRPRGISFIFVFQAELATFGENVIFLQKSYNKAVLT